jgi:hypothetical protein
MKHDRMSSSLDFSNLRRLWLSGGNHAKTMPSLSQSLSGSPSLGAKWGPAAVGHRQRRQGTHWRWRTPRRSLVLLIERLTSVCGLDLVNGLYLPDIDGMFTFLYGITWDIYIYIYFIYIHTILDYNPLHGYGAIRVWLYNSGILGIIPLVGCWILQQTPNTGCLPPMESPHKSWTTTTIRANQHRKHPWMNGIIIYLRHMLYSPTHIWTYESMLSIFCMVTLMVIWDFTGFFHRHLTLPTGFLSSFPMRPQPLFPASLPRGLPDGALTIPRKKQLVRRAPW